MGTLNPGSIVKTDLGNRRGVGVLAFLLALCTTGALAHVAVRMHGIQIAYALGRERRTNTELREQRRRLNIEIGMLKDPDRVIGIARAKPARYFFRVGPRAEDLCGRRFEPSLEGEAWLVEHSSSCKKLARRSSLSVQKRS